jgi:uncharacterized RDD family membrane protein YckC
MSTQTPEFAPIPPLASPGPQPRRIGALWRRLFAFGIDIIILWIIGSIVALPFSDALVTLGAGGRLIGFFIALLYFAIPESSIGSGASIGKRLLLLQVVHGDGSTLTLEESLIRYTVFAVPAFLDGQILPIPHAPFKVTILIGIITICISCVTQYLILFNRNTRQGLHDLSVKCFVAEADRRGAVVAKPIWKAHWTIAGALFVVLGPGLCVIAIQLLHWGPLEQLLEDRRIVQQLNGVQTVSVTVATERNASTRTSATFLNVLIRCDCEASTQEGLADEAVKVLITSDPNFKKYAAVRVFISRGYDIGIAWSMTLQRFSYTPSAWDERLFATPLPPAP